MEQTYSIKTEYIEGYLYWECPKCGMPVEEDRNPLEIGEALFCLGCGSTFRYIKNVPQVDTHGKENGPNS